MAMHASLSVNMVFGLSYTMYDSAQIQFHSSVPRDQEGQGEFNRLLRRGKRHDSSGGTG